MALNKRTKLGIALAVAVLAGLTSALAGGLVLVLAWLLIAWGQAPQRTETFLAGLPGGNYFLKALARINLIFWPPDLSQKDLLQEEQEELAPEELGQEELAREDTAQDAGVNLVREEYFRQILRGCSLEARRRLRQLNTTQNPQSVLDEEWVQYFRDGLVETTHSGRGGVRSELMELIGRLLDEFRDGP
ncbi:MAG: hypothetical protein ACRD36_00025 [Candidatus Acidiferrum sp.]